MRSIKNSETHYNLLGEIYESPRELVNSLKARTLAFGDEDFLSDGYVCKDTSFFGFRDGESLVNDCLTSKVDTDCLTAIKDGIHPVSNHTKIAFSKNVAGFSPIVPLALINAPKAMRTQKRVTVKSKVINLYVSVSVASRFSLDQMKKAGQSMMNYVLGLEQEGYRVGLTAVWGSQNDSSVAFVGMKVKDPSQPLDIARCAYPFVNPSFARGIGFSWYQRTDGFPHDSCYGYALSKSKGYHNQLQNALGAKNDILIYFQDVINNGVDVIKEAMSEKAKCAP